MLDQKLWWRVLLFRISCSMLICTCIWMACTPMLKSYFDLYELSGMYLILNVPKFLGVVGFSYYHITTFHKYHPAFNSDNWGDAIQLPNTGLSTVIILICCWQIISTTLLYEDASIMQALYGIAIALGIMYYTAYNECKRSIRR